MRGVQALLLVSAPSALAPGHAALKQGRDQAAPTQVEDIVDTGRTARRMTDALAAAGAASPRRATLLDKPSRRVVDFVPDDMGFEVQRPGQGRPVVLKPGSVRRVPEEGREVQPLLRLLWLSVGLAIHDLMLQCMFSLGYASISCAHWQQRRNDVAWPARGLASECDTQCNLSGAEQPTV